MDRRAAFNKQKQEYLGKKNRNYLLLGLREYSRHGRIEFFDPYKGIPEPEGTSFFHELLRTNFGLLQEAISRADLAILRHEPYEWTRVEAGEDIPLTEDEYTAIEATVDTYLQTLKAKKEYEKRRGRVAERREEAEKEILASSGKPKAPVKKLTFLMAGGGGGR